MSTNVARASGQYDEIVRAYFESTLSYWEDIYADRTVYARIYQERAFRALSYVDRIDLPSDTPILEIGCGPGFISTALAQRGFLVSALDTIPQMAERTTQRAEQLGLRSRIIAQVGNIRVLPFGDSTFDAVVIIGVTEWLEALSGPLREVARVIRPGGHLIISADNNWPLHQIIDPLVSPVLKPIKRFCGRTLRFWGLRKTRPHFHTYALSEFDSQLQLSGFEKIESQTFGFGPFTFWNRKLLNEDVGWRMHLRLQRLADNNVAPLKNGGLVYLVLARKAYGNEMCAAR